MAQPPGPPPDGPPPLGNQPLPLDPPLPPDPPSPHDPPSPRNPQPEAPPEPIKRVQPGMVDETRAASYDVGHASASFDTSNPTAIIFDTSNPTVIISGAVMPDEDPEDDPLDAQPSTSAQAYGRPTNQSMAMDSATELDMAFHEISSLQETLNEETEEKVKVEGLLSATPSPLQVMPDSSPEFTTPAAGPSSNEDQRHGSHGKARRKIQLSPSIVIHRAQEEGAQIDAGEVESNAEVTPQLHDVTIMDNAYLLPSPIGHVPISRVPVDHQLSIGHCSLVGNPTLPIAFHSLPSETSTQHDFRGKIRSRSQASSRSESESDDGTTRTMAPSQEAKSRPPLPLRGPNGRFMKRK